MILALPLTRPVRPPWRSLGVAVSASALLASMFLPWVRDSTGWSLFTCVLAAALAAFAVRQAVAPRSTTVPLVEVATGCVLLVLVTWFSAAEYFTLVDWRSLRVGAWIGFASAVLLLVFSLSGLRLRLDRSFPVPVLLALVYLFVNVLCTALGLVTLLPGSVRSRFLKLIGRYFVPTTWMSLVGLVVSILLVGAWLRRSDLEGSARRITLAMALLGLALLDIFSTAANSSFEFALSVNGGGVRTATYAGTALALVALGALDHVRNKASIATPGAVELEPS
jgi:hypothetical protein